MSITATDYRAPARYQQTHRQSDVDAMLDRDNTGFDVDSGGSCLDELPWEARALGQVHDDVLEAVSQR